MKRSGTADLPLHGGKAPKWLFDRMVKLAGVISEVFVDRRGTSEYLRHISDPYWFQCLSCVLGFDWHSSGTTTVTCHALGKALREKDIEMRFLGGKGQHSRNVPAGIIRTCDEFGISTSTARNLVRASRLTAKIDSSAVQDGYSIYHHSFALTDEGRWAVIQQGMNTERGYARRYHWLDEKIPGFLDDPHSSVISDARENGVLNLASGSSLGNRKVQQDLVRDSPRALGRDIGRLMELSAGESVPGNQSMLDSFDAGAFSPPDIRIPEHITSLNMPRSINWKALRGAYECQPGDYEELLLIPSMGRKTVRALSLVAELIYGEPADWKDPVRYSFALGGKDGVPYPVDRRNYDMVVELYEEAIEDSRLGRRDRIKSLRDLRRFAPKPVEPSRCI